jgi:hypothetical protein
LDVAEGHSGIETSDDERVAQGMRPDRLVDPGTAGEAPHDPPGGVTVESCAVAAEEDRSLDALTDREVDRPGGTRGQWDRDDLAALAEHGEGAMPALGAECFDVGAESFGDSEPVDGQQRYESSRADAKPAVTSSAPTSLRSRPVACDS